MMQHIASDVYRAVCLCELLVLMASVTHCIGNAERCVHCVVCHVLDVMPYSLSPSMLRCLLNVCVWLG